MHRRVAALLGLGSKLCPHDVPGVGMNPVKYGLAQQVLRRLRAKHPDRGRIDIDELVAVVHRKWLRCPFGQGAKTVLALLQIVLALRQVGQQVIEAADQQTDFVRPRRGQGSQWLLAVGQQGQQGGGRFQRCELAADHPPGQSTQQQAQQGCGPPHAAQQIMRLRKDDLSRHGNLGVPVRYRNAFDRTQLFNTARTEDERAALVTGDESVQFRIDAQSRECFHDAALVGGGNDQPPLRRDQAIAAGLAVAVDRDFVQEVRLVQIDQPRHGADDLALLIANRCRHGHDRG